METIEELHVALQELVKRASGVATVILANQAQASPSGLYATYSLIPVRAYGHVRRKYADVPAVEDVDPALGDWTDLEETVCTSMEMMLSVNILNGGAGTAAMRLHNANFRDPVRSYLYANKIAWRYVSAARNLTGKLQAGLQPRYQADIHLFIEATVSYPVLRAAGFSLELSDETGNPLNGA